MMRLYWAVAIAITIVALGATAAIYSTLPPRIPIHWNIHGQIDAYGPKTWAAFLMPLTMAGMLGLLAVLPWLSPKHFEIDTFRTTYGFIVVLVIGLFGYIHALTLFGTMSHALDFPRAMSGGMFLFFLLLGNVMGKIRRNFFVGIRVPWTLASDRVWNDTHRLAAWLWMGAGALGLLDVLVRGPLLLGFVPLIVAVVVPIGYSFWLSKRLEQSGAL
jgi:uncharacterized membrane protein